MTSKTIRKFKKCNNCKYPNCSTNYCCDICFESDFEKDEILMVYKKKIDEIIKELQGSREGVAIEMLEQLKKGWTMICIKHKDSINYVHSIYEDKDNRFVCKYCVNEQIIKDIINRDHPKRRPFVIKKIDKGKWWTMRIYLSNYSVFVDEDTSQYIEMDNVLKSAFCVKL